MKKRHLLAIFLVYAILKLLFLYWLPLPLSFDEAYYWDWSRHLAWGYYSKPPMVAWLIALSTHIFGNTEFGVRLPALLCNLFSLLFVWLILSELVDKKRLIKGVFLFAVMPILTIYSFVMTIDPPLVLFWLGATYWTIKLVKRQSLSYSILASVFIGLGVLTKQTALGLWVATLTFVVFFSSLNKRLKVFSILCLIIIPAIMYFPNVLWNLKHHFVMLKHTESHFSRKEHSLLPFLNYLAGCTAGYTPVFLWSLLSGIFYFKKLRDEVSDFLFISGALFLIVITIMAVFIKININWVLPFSLVAIILWFKRGYNEGVLKVSAVLGITFSLILCGIAYFPYNFPKPLNRLASKFVGWRSLAKKVEEYYEEGYPLVTTDRHFAGELAFYLSSHPEVYVTGETITSQYQIWRRVSDLSGREVFFVKQGDEVPKCLVNPKLVKSFWIELGFKRVKISLWKGVVRG